MAFSPGLAILFGDQQKVKVIFCPLFPTPLFRWRTLLIWQFSAGVSWGLLPSVKLEAPQPVPLRIPVMLFFFLSEPQTPPHPPILSFSPYKLRCHVRHWQCKVTDQSFCWFEAQLRCHRTSRRNNGATRRRAAAAAAEQHVRYTITPA